MSGKENNILQKIEKTDEEIELKDTPCVVDDEEYHDEYDNEYDDYECRVSTKLIIRDNKLVKTIQNEEQKRLLKEKIKYQKENKERKIEETKKRKIEEKEQQVLYKKKQAELNETEMNKKINNIISPEIEEIDDWESLY